MPYQIEDCGREPGQLAEVADFLAQFGADGEIRSNQPPDTDPESWRKRFRWWWDENPYCDEEAPRGLVLRDSADSVVGFFGMIPHAYSCAGREVPSLILTTNYVRRANRDAALGLFFRAQRLKNRFQLVDGGPNSEVEVILSKLGYTRSRTADSLVYPLARWKTHPRSWLLNAGRVIVPGPNGGLKSGRIVFGLDQVVEVPSSNERRLTKHVDRATLNWYLNSGSEKKVFVGLCDQSGALRCYFIAIPWKKFGQTAMVIVDSAAFDDEAHGQLDELVAYAALHPDEAGVPFEADSLIWPVIGPKRQRCSPYRLKYESRLFYHLPPEWSGVDRIDQPFEGDKLFV